MELLPFWVYELVYAIDKYESEHAFSDSEDGVHCFFKELYRVPQETKVAARQLVPYLEEVAKSRSRGMVSVV